MTEQEMWAAYLLEHPGCREERYEAWRYGGDTPDLLAELTLNGTKTATASAYPFYEYERCELPKAGEYSIILNTKGEAVCVIRTTRVTVVPFWQVGAEHAYREGEGDRSLESWRTVHARVFAEELKEIGAEFSQDMPVVCEEFQVVYPAGAERGTQGFLDALTSGERNAALPEEADFFGGLIGSWKIDYVDNSDSRVRKGEWHFSRVLEGMAVQDVIVLPGYEYGTTLRVYRPGTQVWDIAYCYAGRIMRFEAGKQEGRIVLTGLEDPNRKWVFAEIGENHFHWQDITVTDTGEWQVRFDLYAERV